MTSTLTVELPQDTTSPIVHLLPSVGPSLERIAPERAAELIRLTDGVHLQITDNMRWICHASPSYRFIQVSTRVIELAWAFAYAYWTYYKRVLEGKEHHGIPLDLTGDAVLQRALRLLDWALDELSFGCGQPWPEDVPKPAASRRFGSDEHVADEITLCMLAFFLHHELAHTYLTAASDQTDLDHERDCDAAAAEWIFGAGSLPVPQLQKRALGTAVALLLITSFGITTGNHDGVTHPIDFERLVDTLLAHVPPEQEAVWGMVMGILALHTSRAKLSPPPGEFTGPTAFRDAVLAYRDVLRRRLASPNRL